MSVPAPLLVRSSRLAPLALLILAALFGLACGGSSVTPDQACSDLANAECAKLNQCRHNGVVDEYGNLGTCISRLHDNCLRSLTANGTGNSPAHTESCALAYPSGTCQDYLQDNPGPLCQSPTGSLPMSAACAFDGQCQSAFCAVPKGSLCGTCAQEPKIGDPCDMTGCGYNQVCTPMALCQAYVPTGGSCDNQNQVCAPGQTCVIPAAATAGTCQPSVATLGAKCDHLKQTGPACDINAGLFCSTANTCVAAHYVAAATVCGSPDKGVTDNVCTAGSSCFSQGVGTPAQCAANGVEGDACDTSSKGPACMTPDRCVWSGTSGTAGTCAAPDPSMCM